MAALMTASGLPSAPEPSGLILFHHDPNHDDAEIDAMLAEARWQVIEADARLRGRGRPRTRRNFPGAPAQRN